MKLEIVPMTTDDIPTIVEIERSCHVQPWTEGFFLEELERSHSHAYVARRKNSVHQHRVVGYICFWLVVDEVQIFNLAVDIAHRRCGIGRALLHHALLIGYRNQARVAVLEVRRSNDAARQLYASMGFQRVGERKDYYGGLREPAVLMELEMNRDWCFRWGELGHQSAPG
jgi:[ribosomal protein S18]-alanine N-acetyltransferase